MEAGRLEFHVACLRRPRSGGTRPSDLPNRRTFGDRSCPLLSAVYPSAADPARTDDGSRSVRSRPPFRHSGLVARPECHSPPGRFDNQAGVDLGSRLRDASSWPETHEGERSRWWQWPQPVLHVPRCSATAPAVLHQHRPVWRLTLWVVGRAIKGRCLAAVGELHTKAQRLIGQRVVFQINAVKWVRVPPLLSDREIAKAQAEGEGEPGGKAWMPVTATTVSSVRAMMSCTGAMPGRTLWGGPSQAGGLTTMARATSAGGRAGGSKKLIAAW